jgi:exodeoxyribonuclease VII large subunit
MTLPGTDPDTFTVSGLSAAVGRAVSQAFPDQVWVRGEIRDLQRPQSGHVFFSLVDPDDERVRMPVALFANEKHLVNRVLTRSGAVRMSDGVDVRIRGEVMHYASRGTVQVRMTMIDPDHTVGKLAAERARVLGVLAKEGLLERNGRLPFPLVPLRIGLVTSRGSAAEADFRSSIETSAYLFEILHVDARVQGVEAVATMIAALDRLDGSVDVVAIVRGGGSATDLAAFDDEQLARRIAMMRTPVVTGVGHEIDRSVADEVAARSHKTPTEAAAAIVEIVAGFDQRLDTMGRRIASTARRSIDRATSRLDTLRDRIVRSARRGLDVETRRVNVVAQRIAAGAKRSLSDALAEVTARSGRIARTAPLALERARRALTARRDRVGAADPVRLLAKGWSITRSAGGAVIRSAAQMAPGDSLTTKLADGEIDSEVSDVRVVRQDDDHRVMEQPDV